MSTDSNVSREIARFEIDLTQLQQQLAADKDNALALVRRESINKLARAGLPSAKSEEWRYTDMTELKAIFGLDANSSDRSSESLSVQSSSVSSSNFSGISIAKADEKSLLKLLEKPLGQNRLVFIDGSICMQLSSVKQQVGLTLMALPEILAPGNDKYRKLFEHQLLDTTSADQGFLALNAAMLREGALIQVERNTSVSEPLEIVFVTSSELPNKVLNSRVVISIEDGAELSVVERFVGYNNQRSFRSAVLDVIVGEGARCSLTKLQLEGQSALHVGMVRAKVAKDARFTNTVISFGGEKVRQEVYALLDGSGSRAELFGLSVLRNSQHVDNYTVIEHAKPHAESEESYKGVYADRSRGVFSGTIIVREGAQKTAAYQSNRSLLLSNDASVETRPQLKIWADDVKCTHGAVIGELDDNALFYLRSRGVSKQDARDMLIQAFAADIVSKIDNKALKAEVTDLMLARLRECKCQG